MTENVDQLKEQLAQMQMMNDALLRKLQRPLEFKVSEKGAVSAYGLGRFPVTLYRDQWLKVIEAVPALREFLKVNDGKLKNKV